MPGEATAMQLPEEASLLRIQNMMQLCQQLRLPVRYKVKTEGKPRQL